MRTYPWPSPPYWRPPGASTAFHGAEGLWRPANARSYLSPLQLPNQRNRSRQRRRDGLVADLHLYVIAIKYDMLVWVRPQD